MLTPPNWFLFLATFLLIWKEDIKVAPITHYITFIKLIVKMFTVLTTLR
jgi:hypothetical protein